MNCPKMVLFDYGHTLVHEKSYDALAGYEAVLRHAVCNPDHVNAQTLAHAYEKWRAPMDRAVVGAEYEIPALLYDRAVYDALGLTFDCTLQELELERWNASIPYEAMPGIGQLLAHLTARGIRTGVISNLSFSQESLCARIEAVIPDAPFEFYIASSDYGYRKPFGILFEIACRKAGLSAKDIFFCGDNARADVLGAMQAGMTPVWYCPPVSCFYRAAGEDIPPAGEFVRIRHWDELARLIDTL